MDDKSENEEESGHQKNIEYTNCKVCKKEVKKTKIIMHITRNKLCEKVYGDELDFLKKEKEKEREKYQQNYKEVYNQENQEILRKKRAMKYQEKKAKDLKLTPKKKVKNVEIKKAPYNPEKRKEKYKQG